MIGEDTDENDTVEVADEDDFTLPETVPIDDIQEILTLTGVSRDTHGKRLQSVGELIDLLPAERVDSGIFLLAETGSVHIVRTFNEEIEPFPVEDAVVESLVVDAAEARGVPVSDYLEVIQDMVDDRTSDQDGRQPGPSQTQPQQQPDSSEELSEKLNEELSDDGDEESGDEPDETQHITQSDDM